ncbi:transketolase family protein [Citrifermentans bremense]|uniref:transketolase family protein n=1 Tax=Citrifermentans bremense TaxID=60035 RepID=UPI000402BDE8|nr:transketolase C-terminal domain-containing protein [Citrifermentans bremense]
MRNNFINTIIEACGSRDDIFIISGDAGLGVFDQFKEEYPDRFLNLGVAEQNMISFAAGLSITGYKVVLYNIIPFVLYRCFEQVRNDICYQDLPLVLTGIGSGVTYAPMGMTHYSVEDIGIARTLPNLTVISPIDPVEARAAARFALDAKAPVYVRLAKRGEPDVHRQELADLTKPQLLAEGSEVALICHGSIIDEVLRAREELEREGVRPMVVSLPMLQPLDQEALLRLLAPVKRVVCVEEHYASCGLGNILAELKAEHEPGWKLKRLGIPPHFIHEVRDTQGMRKEFGISAGAIAEAVRRHRGE